MGLQSRLAFLFSCHNDKHPGFRYLSMEFFSAAVDCLETLVIALGAGLGIWGVINLLEGYGNDNPGANAHG